MTETKEVVSDELLAVGAQYGYSKTRRHPSTNQFILATKNKIDILDLEKTATQLAAALSFTEELAKKGNTLLVVGTKPEARKATNDYATMRDIPFVKERWIGGTLTNFPEIKKRAARLIELKEMQEKGELEKYTKREKLDFIRETEKLEKNFGGIVTLTKTPDAIFVVDPTHEETAVREALQLNIPVIALANSDCDVSNITYPILANDTASESISYFIKKITDAYKENYQTPGDNTDKKEQKK